MKKALLISAILILFAVSMNSCKKCYVCTITTTEIINDKDSSVVLSSEQCSGKNGAGTTQNLNSAIQDIEANGYICTPK